MKKTFEVCADLTVNVSVRVEAETPEEAVKYVKHTMSREDVLHHAQGECFDLGEVYEIHADGKAVAVELDEDNIGDD